MSERPLYRNREDAGRAVAHALGSLAGHRDVLVLGMPRGGVIVARAVANALGAPLDVIIARKLGVPGLPEVALGAIAEGLSGTVPDAVGRYLGVPERVTARIESRERAELERRVRRFRGDRPLPDLRGRTVVLVDDGVATGATVRAAAQALRLQHPARIVVAAPVGSAASCLDLASVVDEVVVLATPEPFEVVSTWYDDFAPVSDDDVERALRGAPARHAPVAAGESIGEEQGVRIPLPSDGQALDGDFGAPNAWLTPGTAPHGLVILAHGGGSTRHSYRNRFLAGWLRMAGWSTLRVDLLVRDEQERDAASAAYRFDVSRIAARLESAVDWAVAERVPGSNRVMLFGASTGAAAAVIAAVARPHAVRGVIARGGRVDLAPHALPKLNVPILMIVGGADAATLRANRIALRALRGDVTIKIVRGAGHTFEEPRAIGAVGVHVMRWLERRVEPRVREHRRSWWRLRTALIPRATIAL